MNSEKIIDRVLLAFLIFLTVMVILSLCSSCMNEAVNRERAAAIKAGAAHWTIDEVTGEKKFEYRAQKPGESP